VKKSILFLLVAVMAGIAVWSVETYPRIGGEVLTLASRVETTLYGLHPSTVEISDSNLMTWQGGPNDATETVVMIHGYSADKTVWMRFASHFTDHYRVLIVDLPGHGETAFDQAIKYDSISQAQRVFQTMDSLGISRAHVVGNSMGGFIAAQMALLNPDRVQSATLIDAAGVASPTPSDMEQLLAAGSNPFQIHNRAEFDSFYAMTMAQPPWLPRMILDYMADDYIARRDSLAHIFKDFHQVDFLDARLSEFTVPVLVMWGERDRLLHLSMAAVWTNGVSNAELVTYPEFGHMPMVEAPAQSAGDVLTFLAKHR
jgi:abhydrolase domain-containing protein 6